MVAAGRIGVDGSAVRRDGLFPPASSAPSAPWSTSENHPRAGGGRRKLLTTDSSSRRSSPRLHSTSAATWTEVPRTVRGREAQATQGRPCRDEMNPVESRHGVRHAGSLRPMQTARKPNRIAPGRASSLCDSESKWATNRRESVPSHRFVGDLRITDLRVLSDGGARRPVAASGGCAPSRSSNAIVSSAVVVSRRRLVVW